MRTTTILALAGTALLLTACGKTKEEARADAAAISASATTPVIAEEPEAPKKLTDTMESMEDDRKLTDTAEITNDDDRKLTDTVSGEDDRKLTDTMEAEQR